MLRWSFPYISKSFRLYHAPVHRILLKRFLAQHSDAQRKGKAPVLLLAMPIVSFGLGTWQVYQLQWKKSLIQELEDRTMKEPLEISDNNLDFLKSKDMQYRRVKIRGTFDHSKEIHLFPRSQNTDSRGSSSRPNASGAQIITPLQLSSTGEQILVNRGWVDKSKMKPETRPQGQIKEEVEMVAFIRQGEKNHAQRKVKREMKPGQSYDVGSTVPGGPIGGQTRVYLRNEHLQYIITWYGLTLATALMYYKFRKPGGWK